jgi:hypothetical protein
MMVLRGYRTLLLSMVLGVTGCSLLPPAPLY